MDYMKWTIVMLPVVFEEFKVVYIFLLLFFLFTIIFDFSKNLGRGGTLQSPSPPPLPQVSTGLTLKPGVLEYLKNLKICPQTSKFVFQSFLKKNFQLKNFMKIFSDTSNYRFRISNWFLDFLGEHWETDPDLKVVLFQYFFIFKDPLIENHCRYWLSL